jgi:hypothetical protein
VDPLLSHPRHLRLVPVLDAAQVPQVYVLLHILSHEVYVMQRFVLHRLVGYVMLV